MLGSSVWCVTIHSCVVLGAALCVAIHLTQSRLGAGQSLPVDPKPPVGRGSSCPSAGPEHDLSKTLMHQLPEDKFWEEMKVRYGENQNMVSSVVAGGCALAVWLHAWGGRRWRVPRPEPEHGGREGLPRFALWSRWRAVCVCMPVPAASAGRGLSHGAAPTQTCPTVRKLMPPMIVAMLPMD